MKMDTSAKPLDTEETNEGNYSQEQLDDMLEDYVRCKQIEQDPKLLAMLKDYALSKGKVINDLFGPNAGKGDKPKSLKDLKNKYNEVVSQDDEE